MPRLPTLSAAFRWLLLHRQLVQQVRAPLHSRGLKWLEQYWAAASKAWSAGTGEAPILLYSQVAWDDVWQRPQEEARGLARQGRTVIFVSPVQLHQVAGALYGRWKPERFEQHGRGRLFIFSPLILSGEYRVERVRKINRAILTQALLPFFEHPAHALTNSPFTGTLFARLRPELLTMEWIDDFCAFDWSPKESRHEEARLLQQICGGLAGTHQLADAYNDRVPQGVPYFPSGVDVEKLTRPAAEPEDLRALPHPRLLYVGTLNDRLDGALIARVAEEFPAASVVLVGPRRETFRVPRTPPNLHFLGLKPHDALPGYYQHCTVGLMPFANNEAARAINPIKTLEYLAVGLPTLSTPVPDVERFYSSVVEIAEPSQWPERLRRLLAQPGDTEARRQFARGKSWSTLTATLHEYLRTLEQRHGNTLRKESPRS
ncbi:MAG: glycosyltransferase [Candidatus Sumerlaeia bacterium]|nr:glycosyltransferase [Candidatus Sumerlaeia bacterium]